MGMLALGTAVGIGIGLELGKENRRAVTVGAALVIAETARQRDVLAAQLAEYEAWEAASGALGMDRTGRLRA